MAPARPVDMILIARSPKSSCERRYLLIGFCQRMVSAPNRRESLSTRQIDASSFDRQPYKLFQPNQKFLSVLRLKSIIVSRARAAKQPAIQSVVPTQFGGAGLSLRCVAQNVAAFL